MTMLLLVIVKMDISKIILKNAKHVMKHAELAQEKLIVNVYHAILEDIY